jgi:regulatory protein
MSYTITALRIQKHNHQRVNVYLDGKYAFGLARIVAAWLQVGQVITDEMVSQLQVEDTHEVTYQRVLKFISYRQRTETEIRRKLEKKALSEETVEQTIERLRRSGLINDASFAQGWVETRMANHPSSRRALTYELKQRGIDPQIIAQTIDSIDDEEMAFQAALRHAKRVNDEDRKGFLRKMYRYLSQRGFSYEISSQVIPRVWEQIHTINQSQDQEAPL